MRTGFHPSGRAYGPVSPEYSGEFLCPFALCSVQAVEDSTIADLSLTIVLRIIGCGESTSDLILSAEAGHLPAGKVYLVVGDNGVGKSEATHDVLPKKFNNLLSNDFGE